MVVHHVFGFQVAWWVAIRKIAGLEFSCFADTWFCCVREWGCCEWSVDFSVSFLLAALGPNFIRAHPLFVSGIALGTGLFS